MLQPRNNKALGTCCMRRQSRLAGGRRWQQCVDPGRSRLSSRDSGNAQRRRKERGHGDVMFASLRRTVYDYICISVLCCREPKIAEMTIMKVCTPVLVGVFLRRCSLPGPSRPWRSGSLMPHLAKTAGWRPRRPLSRTRPMRLLSRLTAGFWWQGRPPTVQISILPWSAITRTGALTRHLTSTVPSPPRSAG